MESIAENAIGLNNNGIISRIAFPVRSDCKQYQKQRYSDQSCDKRSKPTYDNHRSIVAIE